MGRVLDILEQKLTEIKGDTSLILNKDYMMGLFVNLQDELPPSKNFGSTALRSGGWELFHKLKLKWLILSC